MPEEIFFIVMASIIAVTIWVYVGVKYGTRPTTKTAELEAVEKRLARLEVAIDEMTTELARVSEGQQFVNKLLADRPPEALRSGR